MGHHVTAMCDNLTVVAYINRQGGTVSDSLCSLTRQLLQWAEYFDVQCSGRSPQLLGAGYRVRVVSPSPGGESTPSCLGFSVAGLVRDAPQRKASPVLLPRPGSPGRLRGCVPTSVGRVGHVRFSSLSPGREGCGSSQRDPKSLHDWSPLFGRRKG